jgi:hypothetical protein
MGLINELHGIESSLQLTAIQLVKKFYAFITTMFTNVCSRILSNQSLISISLKYISITLPHVSLTNGLFMRFSNQNSVHISHVPYACYVSSPSYPSSCTV